MPGNKKPSRKQKPEKVSAHTQMYRNEKTSAYQDLLEMEQLVNQMANTLRTITPDELTLAKLSIEDQGKVKAHYQVCSQKITAFTTLRDDLKTTLQKLEIPAKRDTAAEFSFRAELSLVNQKLLEAAPGMLVPLTMAVEGIVELLAPLSTQPAE